MEVVRTALRSMGSRWILHDSHFLLSPSSSQLDRHVKKGSSGANRLRRRILEHYWHDSLHGWHAMGRIPS